MSAIWQNKNKSVLNIFITVVTTYLDLPVAVLTDIFRAALIIKWAPLLPKGLSFSDNLPSHPTESRRGS